MSVVNKPQTRTAKKCSVVKCELFHAASYTLGFVCVFFFFFSPRSKMSFKDLVATSQSVSR